MGGAVTIELQRLRTVLRYDPNSCVLLNRAAEIDEHAVDESRKRRFGETRRDGFSDLAYERSRRHGTGRLIRERDGNLTHVKNQASRGPSTRELSSSLRAFCVTMACHERTSGPPKAKRR